MLILEQNRDSVTNVDNYLKIEVFGSSICAYKGNTGKELYVNTMASYETPGRAQEVFESFLGAVIREDKVFEMPEE